MRREIVWTAAASAFLAAAVVAAEPPAASISTASAFTAPAAVAAAVECAEVPTPGLDVATRANGLRPRAAARRHRRDLVPLNGERPEGFWWPSPDRYLRAIYGDCGERNCCKLCLKGKPCGDTCINRDFTCRVGCGCACVRPTVLIE